MKLVLFLLLCILLNQEVFGNELEPVDIQGHVESLKNSTQLPLQIEFKNKKILLISSNIKSSLFATGIEQGLASNTVMKLINVYRNLDIDFKKDITPESRLKILLEKFPDKQNSEVIKEKILYTSLTTNNKTIHLYCYKSQDGKARYFNKEGVSFEKDAFFIDPLNGNYRISSKFGSRKHPIHGRVAFHKGVDYAAKLGTPIHASAEGIIEYIGNNGGYGKYIRIKHKDGYSTCYAHISKFSSDITLNSKVKQGQVIAYVGSTGSATGPHLHYEVIHQGKHIDPLRLNRKREVKLPDYELKKLKLFVDKVNEIINKV